MAVINTNIMSLNAQRHLSSSQTSLQQALERLSSGLRINSAKDDAAGLAISTRMTTQVNGLNQAVRNANDAISLSQTADGALNEVTNNLQRIRELAVQAANATNSASDRAALDQEVQQRLAEIDRVASTTQFNGLNLLDGSFTSQQFQVGANSNQTITVTMNSARTSAIGAYYNTAGTNAVTGVTPTAGGAGAAITTANNANASSTTTAYGATTQYQGVSSAAITSGTVTINSTNVNATVATSVTGQDATSAYAKAVAINGSNITGVSATANTTLDFGNSGGSIANGTDFMAVYAANGSVNGTYTLTVNGQAVYSKTFSAAAMNTAVGTTTAGDTISNVVSSINQYTTQTGVVASQTSDGRLQLVAADGRNIDVKEGFSNSFTGDGTNAVTVQTAFGKYVQSAANTAITSTNDTTFRGQVTLSSTASMTLGGSGGASVLGYGSSTLTATNSLSSVNVLSTAAANSAILAVDSALTSINTSRATFGAIQNRFESTIANLQTTSENLAAARSRIQDADFAAETANLTRAQILQQAGTAMLAQANAAPNTVLTLLR